MTSRRQRATSNQCVTDAHYLQVLQVSCLKTSLADLLGPNLADAQHKVTPTSMSRVASLLNGLVEKGLRNGVILPSRMECAVKQFASAPLSMHPDLWATKVFQ